MGDWKGKITSGNYSMEATVYYQKPSRSGLGSWHGVGIAEKVWPLDSYDTNVGNIVINSISFDGEISFQGSGKPKGPLATTMGVED